MPKHSVIALKNLNLTCIKNIENQFDLYPVFVFIDKKRI